MTRRMLTAAAALTMSLLSLGTVRARQQGQVTFSDNAPPPNEEQKKEAQRLLSVATSAQTAMSAIGETLRATFLVEQTLASQKTATTPNQSTGTAIAKWRTDVSQLASAPSTGDQVVPFFTGLRNDALAVAKSISEGPGVSAQNRQNATAVISSAKEGLISRFDQAVLEHGLANHQLRFYPYAAVVKQPFIECSAVNKYSRDFRCLPKGSSGVVTDPQWIGSPSINLSDFCTTEVVAPYSKEELSKWTMYVRRSTSLDSSKIKPRC